jgi:glutamate-ammonia-ligase adenylyltransferase
MVTILTTNILSGTLYEIDLRLRPSGKSGLLVSSLEAYEKYQIENAWTWEQQALIRARFVAGDPEVANSFNAIRRLSLSRLRDKNSLRSEVQNMREKMREKLEIKLLGHFDLKQAVGGIADIEFIVQFGVLQGAHNNPSLSQWTDVVRLLKTLQETCFLTEDEACFLKEAYCNFREKTHWSALHDQRAMASEEEFIMTRTRVQDIWRSKFGLK